MNNTISAIGAIINEAAAMKNAYFFSPPGNASGRRSYEKKHSHGPVEWTFRKSRSCSDILESIQL